MFDGTDGLNLDKEVANDPVKVTSWLVTSGRVCAEDNKLPKVYKSVQTTANIQIDSPLVGDALCTGGKHCQPNFIDEIGQTQRYCDIFTNPTSLLFKNGDAKDSLTLPRTNVDNFKFVYPKTKFDSDPNFTVTII